MTHYNQKDFYYYQAKQAGFAARSVYKLAEIDKRYHVLSPGQKVLDLGAHPGSWLQYACKIVGPSGLVVGIDIYPLTITLANWGRFLKADLLKISSKELKNFASNYDVVLSDVAPHTTGVRYADIARSYELTARALDLAVELLKPGGTLVAKIYFGPEINQLLRQINTMFSLSKAYKPRSSRLKSKEIYILGCRLKSRFTLLPNLNHF